MKWNSFLKTILDFVFPRQCLGCKTAHASLCEKCLLALPRLETQVCPQCETPQAAGLLCAPCRDSWSLDALCVASPYQQGSLLQKTVQALKYHHQEDLAERLGEWMTGIPSIEILLHALPSVEGIIPVPLHAERQRERGYNQAESLAKAISKKLQWPLLLALQRQRATFPQAQCSRAQRLVNVRGAFGVIPQLTSRIQGGRFLLVDDVCSTGSTLNACAEALKHHGAAEVIGFVLARGMRSTPKNEPAILRP